MRLQLADYGDHLEPADVDVRRLAREAAGLASWDHRPVYVVPGTQSPKRAGKPYYYSNRSGTIIDHPSSYRQVGWSSLVYHHSTRRLEVGIEWLRRRTSARTHVPMTPDRL